MKKIIKYAIKELVCSFLVIDRKEDEYLSEQQLKTAIRSGEITTDEIVAEFKKNMLEDLGNIKLFNPKYTTITDTNDEMKAEGLCFDTEPTELEVESYIRSQGYQAWDVKVVPHDCVLHQRSWKWTCDLTIF